MTSKRFALQELIPADEAARAPMSRSAVMDDLRMMILASADHIGLVGPSEKCLDDFLGFEVGPWQPSLVPSLDPKMVDLGRYKLTDLINRAYDFAWQVGPRENRCQFEENDYFSVVTYIHAAPTFTSDSSDTPMSSSNSALRQTLNAARARKGLEWKRGLSIADLALLARMTEPAVRASLSKEGIRATGNKNDNGLLVVEHADTLRWLEGRRGYVPTEGPLPEDSAWRDRDVADIFRDQGWEAVAVDATGIHGLATLAGLEQLDASWVHDLVMGRPASLDIEALERIGRVVARDTPRFVGIAVERLMRANAQTATVDRS